MKYFTLLLLTTIYSLAYGQSFNREILIFWDKNDYEGLDYSQSAGHEFLEPVLNFYGLKATFIDVSVFNPSQAQKLIKNLKLAGAVSWFHDNKLAHGGEYLQFIDQHIVGKMPFLVLGDPGLLAGATNDSKSLSLGQVNKVFKKMGFVFQDGYSSNLLFFKVADSKGKEWVEFERSLQGELSPFHHIFNTGAQANNWLVIEDTKNEVQVPVIALNSKGAFIQKGYELFVDERIDRTMWRVNPFKLVRQLFIPPDFPIPDTTTLCGKRLFFAHVDGDGFLSISELDRRSFNGEILEKEILEHYKLPHTISVVVAEIDPKLLGNDRVKSAAKKIFTLPYVEPASHTFSHPLSWEMNPSKDEIVTYLGKKKLKHQGPIIAYKLKNYFLNYEREVVGAMDYINRELAPKDKPAKVLLWSGSCRPTDEALKLAYAHGFHNMNGGDTRFDTDFPSYTYVSPLYRMVNGRQQPYTANSNENIYTNDWEGPYGGFEKLIESFERTERPVRIKPINIYYHFYSVEKESAFKALKKVYDYAISQDIFPVYASQYIKIVNNYLNIKISKIALNQYKIEDATDIKTVRLDELNRSPDYLASQNIIGHKIINDSLYVFLGPASTAKLVLKSQRASDQFMQQECPYQARML